jgi:outer membrane protein assembly factor BamA
MKNRLFLLILFVFLTIPLHSQEEADVTETDVITPDTITSIEITGLKRTKPHVAHYPLEKFLGQDRRDFDQNEVFAVIKDMGVLEPVSAELVETEDGLVLKVTVEEKWSIFPFPFVMVGSGDYNFGLFLIDFNAFGARDNIILGGIYGSSGWNAMAIYNHIPNRSRMPGWTASFMYSRNEKEDLDKDEIIHRRYTADRIYASIGLNYPFNELFTGSFSVSFSDISLNKKDNSINPPEKGLTLLRFAPNLSLRNRSWDGFFLSQKSISLEYSYNHAFYGSSFHQAAIRCLFEHSIIPGFRMLLRSSGVWKSRTDPLYETGPQSAQVNILPREFSALQYAGFSAGLEKYLYKAQWGTLAVQGSWQCVFSYGPISNSEFDHGPAAGLTFYLSRVAIPAVGGGVAYNMNSKLFQGVFSVGMAF